MRRNVLILLALFAIAITVLGSPALIGATYATTENQINSSGADFQLTHGLDNPQVIQNGSQDILFNYNNWEPGFAQLDYFTLTCADPIADFNYSFQFTTDSRNNTNLTALADAIEVYYLVTDTALSGDRDAVMTSENYIGTLAEIINATVPQISGSCEDGSVTFAVILRMATSAGNNYQSLSLLNSSGEGLHVTVTAQTN